MFRIFVSSHFLFSLFLIKKREVKFEKPGKNFKTEIEE